MIAYKYLSRENLSLFREKGTIRINTLYNLRKEVEKIKDGYEGLNEVAIGSETEDLTFCAKKLTDIFPNRARLLDDQLKICLKKGVYFEDNNIVENAYVFCMSLKLDNRIGAELDYNAHYTIINVSVFADTLYRKLNEISTIKGYIIRHVKYENKKIVATKLEEISAIKKPEPLEICFSKPTAFSSEHEVRILFVPQFQQDIVTRIIDCPELRSYCVF
jgi:hypothetical protein